VKSTNLREERADPPPNLVLPHIGVGDPSSVLETDSLTVELTPLCALGDFAIAPLGE